jgi:hypothetical protein
MVPHRICGLSVCVYIHIYIYTYIYSNTLIYICMILYWVSPYILHFNARSYGPHLWTAVRVTDLHATSIILPLYNHYAGYGKTYTSTNTKTRWRVTQLEGDFDMFVYIYIHATMPLGTSECLLPLSLLDLWLGHLCERNFWMNELFSQKQLNIALHPERVPNAQRHKNVIQMDPHT